MITIDKIKQIEERRRKVRKETYTKIYEQFCRKIQAAVNANQKSVILQVPVFLIGYPTYNIEKASAYVKRQLLLGGFSIRNIDNLQFCVTWHIPKTTHETYEPEDTYLPSLINLKKAANKYRA